MHWLNALFESNGFTPHGYCLLWNPGLIWLQAVSDGLIGVSYYSIPIALVYFIRRRKDVAFGWLIAFFATFILACGTTHLVEIWTIWHPDYALQGLVKAGTAIVSVATAVVLWPILPRALALPSPAQLAEANGRLSREIADRTAAVEALDRSTKFTQLLVDTITDGVMAIGPDLVIRVWNPAAERISGLAAQAIIGRNVLEAVPSMQGRTEGLIRKALAGGEQSFEDDPFAVPETGRTGWQDVRYTPFRDETGAIIGVVVIARDVTGRHIAEEALRQAQKMEAVGQLTRGIAHDFNNLLTAIIGNLDLMQPESAGTAEAERLREAALQGALRAAGLTRQLLAFARQQLLSPQRIDVNGLVSDLSELIGRTLGEHIQTETRLGDGLWGVSADRNALESALLNLAINARDAMPVGGHLIIETDNVRSDGNIEGGDPLPLGEYVRIRITDTGTGMAPEVRERALEPFFTTKEVGAGSGLGLSQVYGFVTQTGGHIRLDSSPGRGTTVSLYLPRQAGDAAAAA